MTDLLTTHSRLPKAWEDLCGVCYHRYGDHYTTFDKDNSGCSMVEERYPCACQGFEESDGSLPSPPEPPTS